MNTTSLACAAALVLACAAPSRVPAAGAADDPILSRTLRVTANGSPAAAISDADYNTLYRSHGVPARVCWDLSTLPAARRRRVLLIWFNDSYGYDHALIGRPAYNNLGDYAIEASASAGGNAPPAGGYTTLLRVTDNTLHSREHLLDVAGYNWLCLDATRSDGSNLNEDIAFQADLFDASGPAPPPGILFVGDSIIAAAMNHTGPEALSEQMARLGAIRVPYENAGWPGATSADLHAHLPAWLAAFPGRYVVLALGTNDKDAPPADFRAHMTQLIRDVQAAGKIAVLAPITYSPAPDHAPFTERLNAVIPDLLRLNPDVLAGPDFYTLFKSHPDWIGPDRLHDSEAGSAQRRALWAAWFAARPELRR